MAEQHTLEIKDLYASVETKEGRKQILKGVNLTVHSGETHAIMAQRLRQVHARLHAGRTPSTRSTRARRCSTASTSSSRPPTCAAKELFLAMQYPVEVPGVSMTNFLRTAKTEVDGKAPAIRTWTKELGAAMKKLRMDRSSRRVPSTKVSPAARRSAPKCSSSNCSSRSSPSWTRPIPASTWTPCASCPKA